MSSAASWQRALWFVFGVALLFGYGYTRMVMAIWR